MEEIAVESGLESLVEFGEGAIIGGRMIQTGNGTG